MGQFGDGGDGMGTDVSQVNNPTNGYGAQEQNRGNDE
jgi:hypothetical protein